MAISHIIFDCDGVLIDSEAISMAVDQSLLADCGVMISTEEMHRRFIGMTFQAMIEELEAERGLRFPPDLEVRKEGLMHAAYIRELQPIAGVNAALSAITLPKSIGTNGPRHRALLALEVTGIAHHFAGQITTFEDVPRPKPFPDVYLLAAERAGCAPSNCIVIEDSVTGLRAAVAAGCLACGFTGSHQNPDGHAQTLTKAGAAHVFQDMADLPALLQSIAV
jgi:HAD superfamily hydrolase (TIGR01509 family)